jgi:Zn-dependent protease
MTSVQKKSKYSGAPYNCGRAATLEGRGRVSGMPTPHLAAEVGIDPGPARSRSVVGSVLAFAWVGATVLWAISMAGDTADVRALACILSSLGLLIGIPLNLVAHELGHLLMAWAMCLRVLGMRIGGIRLGLARRAGAISRSHVLVDIARVRHGAPARMILMLVSGPAANLLVTAAAATVITNEYTSPTLRQMTVGVASAGLFMAITNLLPVRTRGGQESDGLKVARWLVRPKQAQAQIDLRMDLALLRSGVTSQPGQSGSSHFRDRRQNLRSAVTDPRPEIAVAGMRELLRTRPRHDDGWQDLETVAAFTTRTDIATTTRARVAGNYALALGTSYFRSLPDGRVTDPDAPDIARIADLAQLAAAADPESLAARTSLGLVRILQDRPREARTALIDVPSSEQPALRARAYAVRGIAETQLGDLDQALRLAAAARRTSPDEPLSRLVEHLVAQQRPLATDTP